MTKTYLLEVGVEEMPAHVVTPSINQLKKRVTDYFKDQRISFEDIKTFSTPRRLALVIEGLSEKQPDIDESVKGPAKKIALDSDGNWTKAAIGFTRGQGATTDDITFKELKGTEYVYVEKHIAGKSLQEVIPGVKEAIMAMNFPTMMKWGDHSFQFVRPIKWLISLLDSEVIPFTILDVTASNQTKGHRFLGHDITINSVSEYEAALKNEFVIADAAKRKQLITDQINAIVAQNGWQTTLDSDLLEEVNNLVEWPTAFSGHFDDKYLTIPDEVLITSMKDHQRFFYVTDQNGQLLPHFISVRNGNSDHLDNVIAGNQKVLTARLEDAMFFYQEDQKQTIADYVEKLKKVSFHDKISTIYEKMQRVQVISKYFGQQFGLTDAQLADLDRAAAIYKFDLVSGMVGEFSELQGIMGEKYALLQGENATVARAISEHYMPISANGSLPESVVGAVLAISDKIDSILTFFAAKMIPSGSNDPYALRRQASGIVRILADKNWQFDLTASLNAIVDLLEAQQVAPELDLREELPEIKSFVNDRIKQYLSDLKIRHDIADAVTDTKETNVVKAIANAQVIQNHKDDADFKPAMESLTRVIRIANKADLNATDLTVKPELFENDSEGKLANAVAELNGQFADLSSEDKFAGLVSLQTVINNYFDETMIMVDDEAVKNNRLSQLTILANLINQLGNLNLVLVKN